MQDDQRPVSDDIWFEYQAMAGRVTGTPVNLKGWLALACAIACAIALGLTVTPPLARIHPGLGIVGLFATNLLCIGLLVGLVRLKGRRRA